jgi:hypothetical protein
MPAAPKPKPADPRVRLSVRGTSGHFEDEFNRNNRVEKILDEAAKRLGLATGPGITYVIKLQRGGVTMNPDEKLAAYDLVDGDVVVIQTSQAEDG